MHRTDKSCHADLVPVELATNIENAFSPVLLAFANQEAAAPVNESAASSLPKQTSAEASEAAVARNVKLWLPQVFSLHMEVVVENIGEACFIFAGELTSVTINSVFQHVLRWVYSLHHVVLVGIQGQTRHQAVAYQPQDDDQASQIASNSVDAGTHPSVDGQIKVSREDYHRTNFLFQAILVAGETDETLLGPFHKLEEVFTSVSLSAIRQVEPIDVFKLGIRHLHLRFSSVI